MKTNLTCDTKNNKKASLCKMNFLATYMCTTDAQVRKHGSSSKVLPFQIFVELCTSVSVLHEAGLTLWGIKTWDHSQYVGHNSQIIASVMSVSCVIVQLPSRGTIKYGRASFTLARNTQELKRLMDLDKRWVWEDQDHGSKTLWIKASRFANNRLEREGRGPFVVSLSLWVHN